MERIGFGLRFLAGLIDVVIMIVIITLAASIVGGGLAVFSGGAGVGYLAAIVISLIPLAYSFLEVAKAATPGKMIMKIAIRQADGNPAPQAVLLKRWATKYSASLLALLAAITTISLIGYAGNILGLIVFVGCFFVLGEARQALHDKIAGTAVYKV